MSELICPICRQMNPDGLENCQHCHAALQPDSGNHNFPSGNMNPASAVDSDPDAGNKNIIAADLNPSWDQDSEFHSQGIKASEWQVAQAEILERILSGEGEEKQIPERHIPKTNHILRIVVALIMLLSALWPMFSHIEVRDSSGFNNSTESTMALIDSYPVGATVLIAVDYAPGFTAELDAGLEVVLDQMMGKDFYLVLASTVPTGPVQGERLLLKINRSRGFSYKETQNYANLGFIPGGAIGLRSFIESPHLVLPFDWNGYKIWESGPLQDIRSATDFALVVVATENADTAKLWIEQVQPILKGVPLIFVLSAQAEPMMRPYYDENAGQIQAIVSGVGIGKGDSGGANIEYSGSKTNPINPSLFTGGMLLLGGVSFYGFRKLFFRKEGNSKGEIQ